MLRSSHRPSLASESPIHHIALIVDDLNKTEEFYGTILGLPIEKRWTFPDGSPRSVWLSLGSNTRLMLEKKTPSCVKLNKPESTRLTQHHTQQNTLKNLQHGWHLLALTISHTQRTLWKKHLQEHSIEVTEESDFSIYIQDPEGNPVALSHWPQTNDDQHTSLSNSQSAASERGN